MKKYHEYTGDKNLIITHQGKAHQDEAMAIGIIQSQLPNEEFHIERRNPTKRELEDPSVWVIDVGGSYDPALKNFDHHQDKQLPASFVLVAEYFLLWQGLLDQLVTNKWKSHVDCHGLRSAGEEFGVHGNLPFTQSPIEVGVLTLFAKDPNSIAPLIKDIAIGQIEYARKLEQGKRHWLEPERRKYIKGELVLMSPDTEATGFGDACRILRLRPAMRIIKATRGEGWSLMRCDDNYRVDFLKLSKDSRMDFIHNTGYLATTKTLIPMEELIELLEPAISSRKEMVPA